MFKWFEKSKNIDLKKIIPVLEEGNDKALMQLLWQPASWQVDYLPITLTMLLRLKKVGSDPEGLRVHKIFDDGQSELIVFQLPWVQKEKNYSPLLVDKKTEKVIGIMQTFNEIMELMSQSQRQSAMSLSHKWVRFIM